MNEELQKQLAASIKDFSAALGATKDFALDQVPDIIQQYVYWGIANNVLQILISVTLITLGYLSTFKWSNQETYPSGDWSESKVITSIISGVVATASVFAIIEGTFQLTKLLIAPKVWLIQQAATLIK